MHMHMHMHMLILDRPLAFIFLVISLTNSGLWSFAKKNLSHDLMHADIVQLASDHGHRASGPGELDNEDSLSTIQHHILHAADHVQFLTGLSGRVLRVETEVISIAQQYASQALPRPALDQPFRPPRHIALTA
jgi:hypothetical protein